MPSAGASDSSSTSPRASKRRSLHPYRPHSRVVRRSRRLGGDPAHEPARAGDRDRGNRGRPGPHRAPHARGLGAARRRRRTDPRLAVGPPVRPDRAARHALVRLAAGQDDAGEVRGAVARQPRRRLVGPPGGPRHRRRALRHGRRGGRAVARPSSGARSPTSSSASRSTPPSTTSRSGCRTATSTRSRSSPGCSARQARMPRR